MTRLLILGAGQYGIAVKELAQRIGGYDVAFLDDSSSLAEGRLEDIGTAEYGAAVVAIGNPTVRAAWLDRISRKATLIDPDARVSPSAQIGEGSIIEAGAYIGAHAKIGRGVIVMANAVVGHNARVEDFCQLKYNCTIAENTVLPPCTKVDCNTLFKEENR